MKTQGEIESEVSERMKQFQREFMGRGPSDVHTHLVGGMLVVRMMGVMTPAEQQLVVTPPVVEGRALLKRVRHHLIETARATFGEMVGAIAGVGLVSLHHDISTVTGEEVVVFTLAEQPVFREGKRR